MTTKGKDKEGRRAMSQDDGVPSPVVLCEAEAPAWFGWGSYRTASSLIDFKISGTRGGKA